MTAKQKLPIVVLGAGVCGLYAARALSRQGTPVVVVEKNEDVGGLAAGHRRGNNFYDVGVHHLHAEDKEIMADIQSLMGEDLIPCEKVARIRYGKGYQRYPLKFLNLITGVPSWFLTYALAGLMWQQLKNHFNKFEGQNAEEALIKLYGAPLYRHFFRDFTHRYWGIHPRELSALFIRAKMPRLSALDVFKKMLSWLGFKEGRNATVESATREETIWFSRQGSRMMPRSLAQAIATSGGEILLNHELKSLRIHEGEVTEVIVSDGQNEKTIRCSGCVSTIPINNLVRSLVPRNETLVHCAEDLRFRQIVVLGLLVNKPSILNALYIYYRNRIFTRISEPSRSGMEVTPSGHSILLVEMTCEVGDPIWRNDPKVKEQVLAELEEEGILSPSEVVECFPLQEEHGYPIFDLQFEKSLAKIASYVSQIPNLRSVGRQGGFCYPNMHQAMRQGMEAALDLDALIKTR